MVHQSTESVYQSAKDIVAKQNKELYPQMLQLLTKRTRTLQSTDAADFLSEQRLRFWFHSVLPLMFDNEPAIQEQAIVAVETVLPFLPSVNYEQHPDWSAIREIVSGTYCKNVNTLRDRHDSNWHRVWSLLLQLIQRDILRSATLINRYLSIVEQGFRNSNLSVRAEAFLCWKVLVEMFARSNELLAPKRIKLVCIPLKSSQSKTEQIALNKFRVWWYLMCELHERIAEYTDTIVEPFLLFCFGPLGAQPLIGGEPVSPITAPGKTYESLMPMAVAALVSLLGAPDELVLRPGSDYDMSRMRQPFSGDLLFNKLGKQLLNCGGEATLLIAKLNVPETDKQFKIATYLWRYLVKNVNASMCYDQFNLMIDNLNALVLCCIKDSALHNLVAHIIHEVATAESFVQQAHKILPDLDLYESCVERVVQLILSANITFSDIQINEIIGSWINCEHLMPTGLDLCPFLLRLVQYLIKHNLPEYSVVVRNKIWLTLSRLIIGKLELFDGGFQGDDTHIKQLHEFAMVPISIQNIDSFAQHKTEWCTLSKALMSLDPTYIERTITFLQKNSSIRAKSVPHNDLIATLIDMVSTQFSSTTNIPVAVFDYVDSLCSTNVVATTIKDLNGIAQAIIAYTKRLDGAHLIRMYQRLKNTFAQLESTVMSMRCDQSICNEYKNVVALHMRTHKSTQQLVRNIVDEALRKELTALQKADGSVDFVVIPSVWKFNPDRLTDQQRDKMKERRTDIPALYNDTSQSQESRSIKPWTPKKLVMQDATVEPMIIEVESAAIPVDRSEEPVANGSRTTPYETRLDEAAVAQPPDAADCIPLSQGSNSSNGSSTSSMRKLTAEELEERRRLKVHSELRRIQMDIVDADGFTNTPKSRTRNRQSSCQSPVPAASASTSKEPKAKRTKAKDTENAQAGSPTTKPKRMLKVAANKDANDQPNLDSDKEENVALSVLKRAKSGRPDSIMNSVTNEGPTASPPEQCPKTTDKVLTNVEKATPKANVTPAKKRRLTRGESKGELLESLEKVPKRRKNQKDTTSVTTAIDTGAPEVICKSATNVSAVAMALNQLTDLAARPIKVADKTDSSQAIIINSESTTDSEVIDIENISPKLPKRINGNSSSPAQLSNLTAEIGAKDNHPPTSSSSKRCPETPVLLDINSESTSQAITDSSTEAIEASQDDLHEGANTLGRRSFRRSIIPISITTPPLKFAAAKSPNTQTMDTLPMDTECAEEVLQIAQQPKHSPRLSPQVAKPIESQDKRVAEADTEPNTELSFSDSMLNDLAGANDETLCDLTASQTTTTTSASTDVLKEDTLATENRMELSPDFRPDPETIHNSILCSPVAEDAETRNAELLNNTLDISPIREANANKPSIEPSTPEQICRINITKGLSPTVVLKHIQMPTASNGTALQHRYQSSIQSSTPQQTPQSASIMSAPSSASAQNVSATNNSPSTTRYMQFKGRGAQLLNMINSRKKDLPKPDFSECQPLSTPLSSADIVESLDEYATPPPATHSTVSAKDLLTFSKTLPSPMASPSFSILKRKFAVEQESLDDFESPASKRKRVSFHDPPVSSTKEYIGHADEHPERKHLSIGAPPASSSASTAAASTASSTGSPAEHRMRNVLRRKSRADSMVEIAKFGKAKMMTPNSSIAVDSSAAAMKSHSNTSVDLEPIRWNVSGSEHESPAAVGSGQALISTDELDEMLITPSPSLRFHDKDALIQHVVDDVPLAEVLDKYALNAAAARIYTRHLSTIMSQDADVRSATLDHLAENHPLEFLDYAVRGNYSSAVCAKLDADVIVRRAAELARTDVALRATLIDEIATMVDGVGTSSTDEPALQRLHAATLRHICREAAAQDEESPARTQLMDAVGSVLAEDSSTSAMTDDQMRLMMQLFDRPMTDKQICECMEMFARNRRR